MCCGVKVGVGSVAVFSRVSIGAYHSLYETSFLIVRPVHRGEDERISMLSVCGLFIVHH